MKKVLAGLLIGLLVFALLPFLLPYPHKVVPVLIGGWVQFLARTLPKIEVNWQGIGMVALCSFLILAALHSFCGWLFRACSAGGAKWRVSSTLAIFGLLWAVFLTAMSVAGLVHQLAWLASSDESWTIARWSKIGVLSNHALETQMVLEQVDWSADRAWKKYWAQPLPGRPEYDPQTFQVIFLSNGKGMVTNALIFYRDPNVRAAVQSFCTVAPKSAYELKPWPEIAAFLPAAKDNPSAVLR